jgi:L-threonylcarbamoyladenylate synthase
MARILPSDEASIHIAAEVLRRGGVVAVPTETVYGLAADAMNASAVRAVFARKGRPAQNPLIVHVLGAAQAQEYVERWDDRCDQLAARFWPGPLTLVLPRNARVPDVVTAGWETVAVRAPAHDVFRSLLAALPEALAAPSANRSTHVSPTTAQHVAEEFGDDDDLFVLDGGPCAVGLESTVLDMTSTPPRVLRPGGVPIELLRGVIGETERSESAAQTHSPGSSARHYAPQTPCELVTQDELVLRLSASKRKLAAVCMSAALGRPEHAVFVLPEHAERYAAMLYDALRRADASGAETILIERPAQSDGLWAAIQDRLRRATAPR